MKTDIERLEDLARRNEKLRLELEAIRIREEEYSRTEWAKIQLREVEKAYPELPKCS